MGGPRQRQPEEQRRPAEITVPRLSEEETRRRAGAGFDAAMATVIRQSFSQPPPAAEVAAIRRAVETIQRRGEDADVTQVLADYVEQNPNSVLARYSRATNGASDWMILPNNRVGFNSSVFSGYIRNALGAARQPFVDTVARLSDPRNRSAPVDMSNVVARIPNAVAELARQLHAQCDRGRNALPVTIAYDTSGERLVLTTKLPIPPQDLNFGKKG